MVILETAASKASGAAANYGVRRNGLVKNVSLVFLTFQNSALILVMHYSRVMPPDGDHQYFTSTAVLLNEVIKLAVSLTVAMYETSETLAPNTPATVLFEQIYNGIFSSDGWLLAGPAALYTLQNLLQYAAVGNLDPVHFQVLYQVKILATALFSVLLLRRHLGIKAWASLVILTIGVCIVSVPSSDKTADAVLLHGVPDPFFPRSKHEIGQTVAGAAIPEPALHLSKRSASYEGIANDLPSSEPVMVYSAGVSAVLISAIASGLAGVYFEKLLKESATNASVWMRNVQLSFYSIIAAFLGGCVYQDGAGIREHGFFEGYNTVVWSAILLQAAGGMLASLVIRDADNIVKNFAMSISIVISFVFSVWIFDLAVSMNFLLGTSLVLISTYIYGTPERKRHRPSPFRIVSFEKPAVEHIMTPLHSSQSPSVRRLNLDSFDGGNVGKSSSCPGSPALTRSASRTHIDGQKS